MCDAAPPCSPDPARPGPDAAERAYRLRAGASQAAYNLSYLSRVTSLVLEGLAKDTGMSAGTPDALQWLGCRLDDAAETLQAIVDERPVRWSLAVNAECDVGRALDMLDADAEGGAE